MGFKSIVLWFDRFGYTQQLNYRGNQSFSTWCGSIISIFFYCLISYYLVDKSVKLLGKNDPEIKSYKIKRQLWGGPDEVLDLNEAFFSVQLSIFDNSLG